MDGSRSQHTKTRNGCGQCKKRRVKCSLQAPVCAHCKRRGEVCDYQFLGMDNPPASSASSNALLYQRQPSTETQLPGPISKPQFYWVKQGGPSDGHPGVMISLYLENWLELQQKLAYETERHPFVQEILSSVSALHDGYSQRSPYQKDSATDISANQHQVAASSNFRGSVQGITDENWLAVLAFAVSTLVVHFDQGRRAITEPADDSFLESILLLRNSAGLGRQLRPWLLRSGLIARVQQGLSSDLPVWDKLSEDAIAELHIMNGIYSAKASSDHKICEEAINMLQQWLHLVSCQPRTWLHFVSWPGEVSQQYIDVLSKKQPMAIVTFIHWCAVMAKAPKRWFVLGWAQRVAHSAMNCLSPEWLHVILWAGAQLEIQT